MSLAGDLLRTASAAKATVTCAESCTGGMVAAAITDVAGSSEIFERGFVTYSNTAKQEMLGVQAGTLDAFGAVSEETVREMADGARKAAHVTLAVAISGIAGPGGSGVKPEGRVCFALASATGIKSETVEFGAQGRDRVRKAARDHALQMLLRAVSRS